MSVFLSTFKEQERYDHFMKAYNKHLKLMKEANDVKGEF